MSNKMLIDASHPEETRVAVVRGNRIEEFDFESQEKKQLRGNIYLAKVTRVEPSLQAAFVDYGGNRHGFLAFSEIHPDYYQIPVADRQALLEADAAEARAYREAEDQEEETADEVEAIDDAETEQEAPKKKPRRRRSRKAKPAEASSDDNAASTEGEQEAPKDDSAPEAADTSAAKVESEETASAETVEAVLEADVEPEEKPKPKRRTTRRKPAAKKLVEEAPEESTNSNEDAGDEKTALDALASENGDDEDGNPTTMAAIVETDSISEDLPDESTPEGDDDAAPEPEAVEKPKPKRRAPRRKPAAKKVAAEASETSTEDATSEQTDAPVVEESKPEEVVETPEPVAEAAEAVEASESDAVSQDETSSEEEKPKKKAPRRRASRSRKKPVEAAVDDEANASNDDANSESEVEQVGQEDALEEVPNPRRQRRHYKIQEVIKRRQVLLVQVVKEERGNKGAALTTYLSLAGRYSVLMPNTARGGGISRKITNAADRKRLKSIASKLDVPQGMGVILRTAGATRTDVEINRDFEYLMRLWEQVRNLTLSSTAPCLVYEEGSLIKRSIRDLYDKDTGEILVCGERGYAEAREFMGMLMPEHTKKVRHYTDSQAMFSKFGVETQLDRMVSPQVTMKSGGYLVINQTEALVAVDVNSGRSTREHSIEDTALQTNLEAAEEVARQLRLRDLAGLIVIDFIDMEEKRNNRAVEKRLKDCLKSDRARIQVGRISHFGLMEMSRQRMRSSVLESTMDVCEHCAGLGYIRSDSAISLHVFRAIEEHVARHNKFDAVVKTTRDIAFHILNHKRAALLQLENQYGLQVIIQGEANISGQEFTIEKGEASSGEIISAAVGFQYEGSFETTDTDDDSEETKPKSRGKRGRNRNHQDENDNNAPENSPRDNNSEGDSDDDKPRRKRRRGKRGGRRKNNAEENGNDEGVKADNQDHGDKTTDPIVQPTPIETTAESKTVAEAVATSDENPEQEPEAPARRTTSRKRVTQKAPIQKKPEPIEQPATSGEAPEPKPEPPRPARRRTTRRVVEQTTETAEASKEPEAPAIAQAEAPTAETVVETVAPEPEVVAEAVEVKEDKKPTKKGWWNRGGGFF